MPRVVVIGGANVDIKGRSHSTFVAGTSNPGDVTMSAGGVGRNIAENLARLGVDTALLTMLGDDANGHFLHQVSSAAGIDMALAAEGPAPTGTYLAILDQNGELVSAVSDMRSIELLEPRHLEAASASLGAAELLVADCNIPVDCLDWLCRFTARTGPRLVIEPVSVAKSRKLLQFARAHPVFAMTPNQMQLEAITSERDLTRSLAKLHALGVENVVVHRGSKGVTVSGKDGRTDVATYHKQGVVDVTGAGDAAVAGFVCGVLEGLPLHLAARLGQASAAVKLSSRESVASALSRDRVRELSGL
jgi:pseudouridine kinase